MKYKPYISRAMTTYRDLINSDYTIKNGRLINNAPPLQTGICKMAKMRSAVKKAEKVSMIADAIDIAEMREEMRRNLLGG